MFGVLLHLTLATLPDTSFTATSPRAAHLLTQSEPPLLAPDAPTREATLETDVAALNARIKAVNVNWPTGAVILSYTGGLVTYVALLLGVVGGFVGSFLIPAIAVGIGGLGLLIAGLVVGMNVAATAKSDRDALIDERDALQRELDQLRTRPSVVDRAFPTPAHSITVARF
ncbi:MAG: hypothetical protein GQE15_29565 [Archangiaceae bacterium]|nr:hypothetical protein [Archangiaceae bacterium]